MTDEELMKYREDMENAIEKYGHFIQGVNDDEGRISYAYTIGRTGSGKSEIYMKVPHVDYIQVINVVCRKLDAGEIAIHEPFTIPGYKFGNEGELTRFGLTDTTEVSKERVMGIYTRADRLGQIAQNPLVIVMGDSLNRLPEIFGDKLSGLHTWID